MHRCPAPCTVISTAGAAQPWLACHLPQPLAGTCALPAAPLTHQPTRPPARPPARSTDQEFRTQVLMPPSASATLPSLDTRLGYPDVVSIPWALLQDRVGARAGGSRRASGAAPARGLPSCCLPIATAHAPCPHST